MCEPAKETNSCATVQPCQKDFWYSVKFLSESLSYSQTELDIENSVLGDSNFDFYDRFSQEFELGAPTCPRQKKSPQKIATIGVLATISAIILTLGAYHMKYIPGYLLAICLLLDTSDYILKNRGKVTAPRSCQVRLTSCSTFKTAYVLVPTLILRLIAIVTILSWEISRFSQSSEGFYVARYRSRH
jgi:hypothetical protein